MFFTSFLSAFSLACLASSSLARLSHRSFTPASHHNHRRDLGSLVNRTLSYGDNPEELVKRDGTKYVFMHHIVGNTYPYTDQDWRNDIMEIQAKGVDALALNIGSSDWQKTQIGKAYASAQTLGTNFKLFISFDFSEMGCNINDIVSRVKAFSDHPNQFKINGKVFISSYSGDCLGDSGWASLKSQTNGYIMPFIWGLENNFGQWPSLDSWYCWGCAWPQGNYDKSTDDDYYYINQLSSKYATTVSMWLFTHLPNKNFYQRGDNWLINNRWEQLVSMRDKLTFVEMVTWNDYGESDYFGPIRGAQPAGTYWADDFPHTAWFDMSEYYIKAFKTGSYPAITKDVIYFWSRPHPALATASSDSLGRPTGYDWALDYLWAAVFSTSSASVTLKIGTSSQTFPVNAGISKLKIPTAPGKITVQMSRNGQTIIDKTPNDFTFVATPVRYNYNAYVGAATASVAPPNSSSSTTSSTATSTSTTTSTSTSSTSSSAPTPTTTSVNGDTWTYRGCYPDPTSARTLYDGIYITDGSNTISKCLATCSTQGYAFGGVEYGKECFCGTVIRSGVNAVANSECNMGCAGNANEKCGNGNRLNIYSRTLPPTSAAFTAYGCIAEGTTGSRRALTGASYSRSDMTPLLCQSLCSTYQFAGVEYGVQCYCGNTLTNNGATGAVIANSNCQTPCGGDSSQKCGGGWTMNLYQKTATPWSSAGCYVDTADRMLRGSSTTQAGMTTEKCIAICDGQGHTIAATEYGKECYCGSQLYKVNGSGVATSASQCNMPCDGNASQTCGASWRGSVYTRPGTVI